MANIEVSGVGAAVMPEVRNLRQLAQRGIIQADTQRRQHPEHDWRRALVFISASRHDGRRRKRDKLEVQIKIINKYIYSELRDALMLRTIEIRSIRLVKQLQAIVEDEGWLGAGPDTGENDDLCSAMVLAYHTWVEWKRPGLIARNLTWESVKGDPPPANAGTVLSFAFSEHVRSINARAGRRKEVF